MRVLQPNITYRYYALLLMCDERLFMCIYVHLYFSTLASFLEDEKIFPDIWEHFKPRAIEAAKVKEFAGQLRAGSIDAANFRQKLEELMPI